MGIMATSTIPYMSDVRVQQFTVGGNTAATFTVPATNRGIIMTSAYLDNANGAYAGFASNSSGVMHVVQTIAKTGLTITSGANSKITITNSTSSAAYVFVIAAKSITRDP